MQGITKMQIQTMDQSDGRWEEQIKSPNPRRLPVGDAVEANVLAQLRPGRQLAKRRRVPKAAMNPLQFCMQFAEQWQKAWADAMAFWVKAGKAG